MLQGYYIPLLTDIARHLGIHDADVNWLEAAQLMLPAIAVPVLAKLGDPYGHRRMLLASAAVVAVATGVLAVAEDFGVFLAAWAVQGVHAAWLPLQVALIYSRSRGRDGPAARTRRATVAALPAAAAAAAVFAVALAGDAPTLADGTEGTAGSLSGYLTVWLICGTTALIAAGALVFVPRPDFSDGAAPEPAVPGPTGTRP